MIEIVIDYREKRLISLTQDILIKTKLDSHFEIKSENLPLGDIIIKDNEKDKELVIIERKSLSDLACSIKDNRYTEQSFRLNECNMPNHNIIYLIEGDMKNYKPFHSRVDKKVLWSSMFSLLYYKGFSVIKTISIEETAECIIRFADKLRRDTKIPYYNDESQTNLHKSSDQYSSVVKRTKKNNITTENIGEIMLMQIPGVSLVSTKAIINKYKTIKNLIHTLEKYPKCLEEITYINNSGKSRRLTKSCINNIFDYLIVKNEITIE
jgi:crossover junction endonuclease MUS81